MQCPNCGTEGFYQGLFSADCKSASCKLYKALETDCAPAVDANLFTYCGFNSVANMDRYVCKALDYEIVAWKHIRYHTIELRYANCHSGVCINEEREVQDFLEKSFPLKTYIHNPSFGSLIGACDLYFSKVKLDEIVLSISKILAKKHNL